MRALRGKTEVRRLHRDTRDRLRPMRLVLVLQDWDDAYNVGGMFRVADACGAEVWLTGKTPAPGDPQVSVTSLGNHRRVAWRKVPRHDDALKELKADGFTVVAVEIAEGAVPHHEFDYPERTALVLGNEAKGVYPNVLRQCDAAVMVPMAGKGRSLNVHVAGAIVAFQALLQEAPG